MIWILLLYLSLAITFIARGIEQGILWSKKGADAFKWNEHIVLGISRVMIGVVALVSVVVDNSIGFWSFFLTGLTFIPSFWFWHNTSYYLTRHKIDPKVYKDWFTADSTTSTARLNISFEIRIITLCISLIGLVLIMVWR